MIKYITKRDGRIEQYQPKKINDWGKWAAKDIGDLVDWSNIVIEAVSQLPETVTSVALQERLIQTCLNKETWSYYLMAGKLYAAHLHRIVHGSSNVPTIKEVHKKLIDVELLYPLKYSDEEYDIINEFMDHQKDFITPHFSLHYIRNKYSLKNRTTGTEYETQQFVYMRMAMALAEKEDPTTRLDLVKEYYTYFSNKRISAPTPNYVNLGTHLKTYVSCCLYTVGDDVKSLAIGDHIAYLMTASSAGIGSHINTRSKSDPVRGGLIEHQGKLPYYAALGKAVRANQQNGRSGAVTTYYSGFDPEAEVIAHLRNPRSTEDRKNRDLHYALQTNEFFARKVARNEEAFSFNSYTAPDLTQSFFDDNAEEFGVLYDKYLHDPNFKKEYFKPRNLLVTSLNEAFETGVAYLAVMDEINRHTPFKETIYSSNLCLEIAEPNRPYYKMEDLYSDSTIGIINILSNGTQMVLDWNSKIYLSDGTVTYAGALVQGDDFKLDIDSVDFTHVDSILFSKAEPEVALCSLGALPCDIETDEEYEQAMYLSLKMIDYCILHSNYVLPHIGVTAKSRMNAGVGLIGLATEMAKRNLRYDSKEGLEFIHYVSERHMYFAIKASLRLARERGNAPWIHKTKWADGWLPIDTYKSDVDSLADFKYHYDWEALRAEVIAQGGIGHSCLVAHMPQESSSKSIGYPNSIYPVRDTTLIKTDNSITVRWAAPKQDDPEYVYQSAWDISEVDMLKVYAVVQKFTDQTISADLWRRIKDDTTVSSSELIRQYLTMIKYGVKTRYYYNSNVSSDKTLDNSGNINDGPDCDGCSL